MLSLMVVCGWGSPRIRALSCGKVLISDFSIEAKRRLFAKVGFTNVAYCGYGERDSTGSRLCFPVETHDTAGQRSDYLVVVTAEAAHVKPWRIFNEKMTDDEELAVWEDRVDGTNSTWRLRNGGQLPKGHYPLSVSGGWIALGAKDRGSWLARLETPTVVAAELPESSNQVDIFAHGQTVHVFARHGWRNAQGPMKYLVYDFARGARPIGEMTLPWVRVVWDMDPSTRIAVVNDNNNFWGRIWLLDLNTGKRRWISTDWPSLIVNKEVAQKWMELTRP
jgi:hypothetical protein